MSCGIICRQDAYSPWAELERIRRFVDTLPGVSREPEVDQFERRFWITVGSLFVISQLAILGLLAYGLITIAIGAVS